MCVIVSLVCDDMLREKRDKITKLNIRKLRNSASDGDLSFLVDQGVEVLFSAARTVGGFISTPLGSWICLLCGYADTYKQRP